MLHDLALEDPDLNAAGAVRSEGRRHSIIDIRAQRVQRDAALAIPFHACDLGAAEASRAIDANAARTEPHCGLYRPLHGTAEGDPPPPLLALPFAPPLTLHPPF